VSKELDLDAIGVRYAKGDWAHGPYLRDDDFTASRMAKMAHARADIPALIAEVRALRVERDALAKKLEIANAADYAFLQLGTTKVELQAHVAGVFIDGERLRAQRDAAYEELDALRAEAEVIRNERDDMREKLETVSQEFDCADWRNEAAALRIECDALAERLEIANAVLELGASKVALQARLDAAYEERDALAGQVATMRAALEAYAAPGNWCCSCAGGGADDALHAHGLNQWIGFSDGPEFAIEALALPVSEAEARIKLALALAEAYHELRRTLLTPYRSPEDVREYESWYRHGAGLAKAVDLALKAYQAARGAK